ncbi:hypothetical protein M3Y99_01301700 [Aphelenchoides fujianensis]|nr:hypothetical protein M3Y99_01301700 [Aphelenchoides fujianensis]
MKCVLDHLAHCENACSCAYPHCTTSRSLVAHWKQCGDMDECRLCAPVIFFNPNRDSGEGMSELAAYFTGDEEPDTFEDIPLRGKARKGDDGEDPSYSSIEVYRARQTARSAHSSRTEARIRELEAEVADKKRRLAATEKANDRLLEQNARLVGEKGAQKQALKRKHRKELMIADLKSLPKKPCSECAAEDPPWKCTVCEDLRLCDACKNELDHEHVLDEILFTLEEKRALSNAINRLSSKQMSKVLDIINRHELNSSNDYRPEEFEVDFTKLKPRTYRELQAFVRSYSFDDE